MRFGKMIALALAGATFIATPAQAIVTINGTGNFTVTTFGVGTQAYYGYFSMRTGIASTTTTDVSGSDSFTISGVSENGSFGFVFAEPQAVAPVSGSFLGSGSFSFNLSTKTSLRYGSGTFSQMSFMDDGVFLPGLFSFAFSAAAVPEPTTWALMLSGFAIAGTAMRRRGRVAFA